MRKCQIWSVDLMIDVPENWLSFSTRVWRAVLELKSGMCPAKECQIWSVEVMGDVPDRAFPLKSSIFNCTQFEKSRIGPKIVNGGFIYDQWRGHFWRTSQLILIQRELLERRVIFERGNFACKHRGDIYDQWKSVFLNYLSADSCGARVPGEPCYSQMRESGL